MATFSGESEHLPQYALCTVEQLVEFQEQRKSSVGSSPMLPEQWESCKGEGRYAFNGLGRLILITRDEREIAVVAVPKRIIVEEEVDHQHASPHTTATSAHLCSGASVDIFAFDKNCYHVGYPMDMGDIEDIDVCQKSDGAGFHVTCITCPLHNRIFDLRTGGMVTVAYDETSVEHAPCHVRSGKRKGGAPSVVPCHQRVHPVTITQESQSAHRIVVHDTFGRPNDKLLSDKYNPVGAAEDFHEFNPKRGNSFVQFRAPDEPKKTSHDDSAPSNGAAPTDGVAATNATTAITGTTSGESSQQTSTHDAAHHRKCCIIL